MAIRERKDREFKPYYEVNIASHDEELKEALEARKEHLEYRDGQVFESDFLSREEVDKRTEEVEEQYIPAGKLRESRRLTARRLFEAVISIALIIMVGCFAFLLLYPQTELSELSKDISDTKDKITEMKNKIIDAEEEVNGITDMDSIRTQALALGMQDPNQNQVVILPVPSNDTLTNVVSYDAYGISEEALDNAKGNLAEYYRTHTDK